MAVAALAVAVGCQSTGKKSDPMMDDSMLAPPPMVQFTPAKAVASIHFDGGRYPNLLSPESYAVWVDSGVAALKKEAETSESMEPEVTDAMPADLATTAARIDANYFVFECHIESAFPDASIAYDMVGLRNTEIYLDTPEGIHVRPIQRILGTSATETQEGAIKRFGRTLILVFPKMDIVAQAPTVSAGAPAVRLVLENFNSSYHFEWPASPAVDTGEPRRLTQEEVTKAVKMGYTALYSRLRELAQMFH